MPQRISDRDQRIVIQAKADSQNTFGELVPTPSTLATRWARVTPLEGTEHEGEVEADEQALVFNVQYGSELADVNPKQHQISFKSKTWDLISVVNVGQANVELDMIGVYRG